MTVKVYNMDGAEVGTVELKPEVFGIEPNESVVHQYLVNFLARQRQGTAKTKTRHEVSGSGKKPWRQKGTGRARAGSTRSPLWRGGGTVFGPKPRSYGSTMPRQMKRLALQSIFSDKARQERIIVVDRLELGEIKTKKVATMLSKFDLADKKCLILDEGKNDQLVLSTRNIPSVAYRRAALASGYDVINAEYLLFTRAGLDKVQEVFA